MSTEFRKHRDFPYKGATGVLTTRSASTGALLSSTTTHTKASGDQTTWSRDTLFPMFQKYRAKAKAAGRTSAITKNRSDLGSPFLSVTHRYRDNGCLTKPITMADVRWIGSIYGYSGPVMGLNPESAGPFGHYPVYSDTDLRDEMLQKGTTAIARTIPTNPMVGVGQLIGESIDRLPSIPGRAILGKPGRVSKKFADEYLNFEFGLKPLLSDIDGIVETVRNSNRILEQLERDSGRLVRRRYQFPVERTFETIETGSREISYPLLNTRQYAGAGLFTVRRETVKRFWFSGAYSYLYRQSDKLWDRLRSAEQRGNKLFGLRLSPSLAWELAPWSWAADWVTNAGDVITNLSAFSRDGLVLHWGYIMCDLTITDTHTFRVNLADGQVIRPVQIFETRVKKRLPATPYGFGLDPDWKDFSSRQLAILGALGISRVR